MSKKFFLKFSFLIIIGTIITSLLYSSIPSQIILPQGSQFSLNTFASVSLSQNCISSKSETLVQKEGSVLTINTSEVGNFDYDLKLFNKIPLKKINVSVVPKNYVIPGGETLGIKMYTKGLLVVYVSEVTGVDGISYSPARDSGIKQNDRILSVDGLEIHTNEEFSDYINSKKSTVDVVLARDDEIITTKITPVESQSDKKYKLGIWVRDSTAGIGTLTFYNPENSSFASLGHAICDSDTMSILKLSEGRIMNCEVISVKKGEYGAPGELKGSMVGADIGEIKINDSFGIYGHLYNDKIIDGKEAIETATRFEVKEGPASMLCDIDGKGVLEYSVEITKVSKSLQENNKGMVITVTDKNLIEKTGGIVQGMSGSPLIQNGKLIGAVTHVFVNDPTRGYGIFIENMLAEAEKISD